LIVFLLFTRVIIFSSDLTIGWWNVENFFDTVRSPDSRDTVLSAASYQSKLDAVVNVILEMDADILGLTEVENIGVLRAIAERTGYSYYYLIEGNDPRGIDIALLSRYQPVYYRSHRDMVVPYPGGPSYKFSRDCPEVKFIISGREFYLLLNHLKSMYGDDPNGEAKRLAQTRGIISIVSEIYENSSGDPAVIILGDFNTYRNTPPLNLLERAGFTILNYKYSESDVYTYNYNGQRSDIDYVIYNEHFIKIYRIERLQAIRYERVREASDHYPLLIEVFVK